MRVPICAFMQDMSSAHLDITELDGAFVSSQLCEGMRGKPAAHPNLHDRPAPCVQWQLLTLSVNRDYWYEYSICHMPYAHLDIAELDGAFASSQLCEGVCHKPAAHIVMRRQAHTAS